MDGLAELYTELQKKGAVFHYVSASPWHLYMPLLRFMAREGFPQGTLHLRNFRLKDSSRWNLLESSRPHKLESIRELMARFPKRRFLLIGDASESDPEIYGTIARERPGQVEGIYIRRPAASTWTKERHRRAFAGLNTEIRVFDDAASLPSP